MMTQLAQRTLLLSLLQISLRGTALAFAPLKPATLSRAPALSMSTTASPLAVEGKLASLAPSESTTVDFAKYHGLGNDFIMIDNRELSEPSIKPETSAKLCDRNFGVGGDGVIFLLKAPQGDEYDYTMRIHNADGSEPEMCGNGIRCLAAFLKDLGETKSKVNIYTLAGKMVPVINDNDTITVEMGEPTLEAAKVPTLIEANHDGNSVVEQSVEANNGKTWKISAVSMGNPHAIAFVDDLENDVVLDKDGPALERDTSLFPQKTNVEFVQVMSPSHLKMKVWERGAGPTLACGTGACALVVAAIRANKIPRQQEDKLGVRVSLPGGDLWIDWKEDNNKVYMTGPATFAFQGSAVV